MNDLFSALSLGDIQLRNRIIMAPMTRSRALIDGTPSDIMREYYQQRASAGLIITEGVYPSDDGKGYLRTPGINKASHIKAWKKISTAVHSAGGKIVMQIMHCGRIAHHLNKPDTARTVAPSAIRANGAIYTDKGLLAFDEPQALSISDIKNVIEEYKQATINAFEAGFDGVELHCTSGYLPAQFLSTGSNSRTDEYGGSALNRCRFVVEILNEMCDVMGSGRVGLRICPGNPFNDLFDESPADTFSHLLSAIRPLNLAYLHAIKSPIGNLDVIELAKRHFQGPLILNDGFNLASANEAIQTHQADAVSFGRAFIANPDLVERFSKNLPLAHFNPKLLYTADEKGYCDYPAFQ